MRLQPRIVAYAIACLLALPAGALAATFTVDSTSDAPDLVPTDSACVAAGPTPRCTLRAAIQQANADQGDDTIILPAGTYQLTVPGAGDNSGAQGDLDLDLVDTTGESLTISGAGARTTKIVGTGDDRVIESVNPALTANISGVTITGGQNVQSGGGIFSSGPLNLTNAAVSGNQTIFNDSFSQGGGIFANGSNTLTNVTVSGNVVTNTDGTAHGGGLFNNNGVSNLTNVTISGNGVTGSLGSEGGGLYSGTGATTRLQNVTVAGNTLAGAQQIGAGVFGGSNLTFANTIVALNRTSGGQASNCGGNPPGISAGHNLEEGTDCGFTAAGDKRSVDPVLGLLADNGGQSDTRALGAGSPALDAADNATCPSTDQRGAARPQNAICDIGAFELVPATLPPPLPTPLPKPVLGKTVNVTPVKGTVLFAVPPKSSSAAGVRASQKGLKFRPLKEARQLPVRSFLNTRRGTVRLTSARPKKGATQTGTFSSGLFQILQSRKKKAKGLTELRLKGSSFKSCTPRKRGKRAQAALSKKAIRRLRSNAGGRFRTRGRYGAATVRGTKWLTSDRCDGTLVKVTRGKVAVRDFRRKKTIVVKRGKRYLAKAPQR